MDKDYTRLDLCRYMNHSDNPNVYYLKRGKVYYFYTLKSIIKDEELTINYHLFDFECKRDF
jgi:SET domain-containing protein